MDGRNMSLSGRMTLAEAENLPATLDKHEVGRLCGIHSETVTRLARRGEIPGRLCGHRWVFPTRAVLTMLGIE